MPVTRHAENADISKTSLQVRQKKFGYYITLLAEMKNFKGTKRLSDVQIRLIVNKLQKIDEFEDAYYLTFTI